LAENLPNTGPKLSGQTAFRHTPSTGPGKIELKAPDDREDIDGRAAFCKSRGLIGYRVCVLLAAFLQSTKFGI
jgi:hypothetical protein